MSRAGWMFAALLTCALIASVESSAEDVRRVSGAVQTPEHPAPRAIEVVRIDGVDYLDVNDVARVFRATRFWRVDLEKMVLKLGNRRVRLTVGSPFVFVDEVGKNILAPVRWDRNRLMVPVQLLTGVLDELVTERVYWDRETFRLRLDTGAPNIVAVDYDVRRNGTVAEIRLTEPLPAEVRYPRADEVVVQVPGGVLSDRTTGTSRGIGLVDSLETVQEPGVAILRFHLGPLGGAAELLTRTTPPRLLLAVSEGLPDDIPLPEFQQRARGGQERSDVKVVVIDAGHGGSDTGVLSERGNAEKDVALSVALRMKELLRDEGLDVRLTREDDTFIPVQRRTELANGVGADVFVSLHCNGWFESGMSGFSVGVRHGGPPSPRSDFPLWGARSQVTQRRTDLLAEIVSEKLEQYLDSENRGVRYGDYAVLEGASMPAIFVECGFLTNSAEDLALSNPEVQDAVAAGIALAIEEYREALRDGRGHTP